MKDKVKVIFKNLHDFSEIEADNLRIEYGGQVIEFEDGEIRITPMAEKIEKPDRQGRCTAWQECILKYCGECEHGCSYYKPARRENLPPVMHL